MKKTIQKITGLIALSAWLVNYGPVWATVPNLGQRQFDINEEIPWSIGVKLWEKMHMKTVVQRLSSGSEFAVGPFVE